MLLSMLALAGCNKPAEAPPQNSAAATAAPQPAPYVPPTAEQLSQMVAPIALFPDKLVGQVLAGATYPEQITAANQWLAQNPSLKGDALQTAEASQPWDVSVKSLTSFPAVLNQMAGNPQWTSALGDAYVNDPTDVMNAIQAMRARARQAGTLKSSPHLRVSTTVVPAAPPDYGPPPSAEPLVYTGPEVIPPPAQTIVIEPAEPDVVYVPEYNPAVVYGSPVPVYPGWVAPRPAYTGNELAATGVISFGLGVLVGAAVSHHHDNGWHSWGVNWGGPRPDHGGWHRPAVVHDNTTYVSRSVTVVNRVNNINVTNNNYRINNPPPRPPAGGNIATPNLAHNSTQGRPPLAAAPTMPRPNAPMTMPHFGAHDTVPGTRPAPVPPAMPAAVAPGARPAPMPQATPGAVARHGAPTWSVVQHDQRPQPRVAHDQPVPGDSRADAMRAHKTAREHAAPAQVRIQAGARGQAPAQAQAQAQERAHAQTPPPQHGDAPAHMPPPRQAQAQPQHASPIAHENKAPDRPQPHAPAQNMVAMHTERPHAAPPAPPSPPKPHAEKHQDNKRQNDKHEGQPHRG
ncbi:DUF3300 domain-containing protein [Duganella callida]|uniref:DUF3300 domain-containing protein n=1 Tax=Duganella callida TaxID=2561932 RepID=A0A4Y9S4Z3_9BURK|nr:DUF3300 domain-containing protein [Duganella callida]